MRMSLDCKTLNQIGSPCITACNNFNNQNDKRGTITFNQGGTVMNNQNDKRGNNTTFNQGGTVMNNQNDKRGIVMNTTVINNQKDKRGTVMNNQNDLIIGDEYKCLAMTINYWR